MDYEAFKQHVQAQLYERMLRALRAGAGSAPRELAAQAEEKSRQLGALARKMDVPICM